MICNNVIFFLKNLHENSIQLMLAYIHTICFFLYTSASSIHTARKSEYKGNPPSQEDNIKAAQNKNQKKKRAHVE